MTFTFIACWNQMRDNEDANVQIVQGQNHCLSQQKSYTTVYAKRMSKSI
jgi:hypothetical protein